MEPALWSLILMFPISVPYKKTGSEFGLSVHVFISVSNHRMLSKLKMAIFQKNY